MSNKFAVWGLVVLAVLLVTGYYFFFLLNSPVSDAFKVIPDDAVVVMQVDNPADFYEKISHDNEIWKSLKKGDRFSNVVNQIELLDSIIGKDNFLKGIDIEQMLVSIHYDTTFNETHYLLVFEVDHSRPKKISDELQKFYNINRSDQYPDVISVQSKKNDFSVFTGLTRNLFLVSDQDWLVNRVLKPHKSKKQHFSETASFNKLRNTAGRNTDARIYFNYKGLSKLLNNSLSKQAQNYLNGFRNFARWTETDLKIKNDELLFSGFTLPSKGNYLAQFSDQKPGNIGSFKIAPFNTSLLFAINFSDIRHIVNPDNVGKLSKAVNFDLNQLLDVLGYEMGSACNDVNHGGAENNCWFFIRMKDAGKAERYLKLIASNTVIKSGTKSGTHMIRQINHKNFIPQLFGESYEMFENTWYTTVDNYVVFANTADNLSRLIGNYESGRTLDLNENFKQFSDNIAGVSNVFLYISPPKFTGILKRFLNPDALAEINNNEAVINDFQGISFQFAERDSMFYTNFYIHNDKQATKENLDLWRVELDNEITGKPYLVKDHKTNIFNIIVFDKDANLYLVTSDGQIAWKKRLDNIPESAIYQVDYYKNGKIQYLFNTRDFIYLLDLNGNNVIGYPKKINPSATNGLNVFDYEKNKDYRILIAQADKRVYNYTIDGKKVDGWVKPRTENIVTEPIVHLATNKRDYILITDINNDLYIVDRRGNPRIKLRKNPEKAFNSTYYINQTNSKGIILTTDKYGRLTYISTNGKLQYTEFGEYNADHFFLYEDFDGNGSEDFIYLEGNQLNVFNRFKKVLFNYKFPAEIKIKPVFFELGRNQNVLGIVDKVNKTIYLFDKHGNPIINSGLVGENPFTIGSLNNDDEINMVTSVGKTLYNYRLK